MGRKLDRSSLFSEGFLTVAWLWMILRWKGRYRWLWKELLLRYTRYYEHRDESLYWQWRQNKSKLAKTTKMKETNRCHLADVYSHVQFTFIFTFTFTFKFAFTFTFTFTWYYITLRCVALHYGYITSHYVALRSHYDYVALRHITLYYVILRYVTSHYITLLHIISHCITLHHIESHRVTSHYIYSYIYFIQIVWTSRC